MLVALVAGAPLRAQSLSNFSALVNLAPGGTCTVGFFVPGSTSTTLLLRAVGGASLQHFGVSNPGTAPGMQIFNSKGMSFIFATTDIGVNFPALYASVGAFPLTIGAYCSTCGGFSPGAYTVQITDDSGHGGTVLFEVYLVSSSNPALGGPLPVTPVTGLPVLPVTTTTTGP